MRFKYNEGEERVVLEHGGDTLIFSVSAYKKTDHMKLSDPYRDLNKFFQQQSAARQQMIFDVYREASVIFGDINNPDVLGTRLKALIELLYTYLSYDEISNYVKRAPLSIPTDIKTQHDPSDKQPDRTFIVSDYWELVKVALALRAAIPLFSRYMDVSMRITGVHFKERETSLLIQDTWIMSSPAHEKLSKFTAILAPASALPATAVFGGISKGEFPNWLMATILVRRVAIGEIDSSLDRGSVVANVWQYVRSISTGFNPKFGGPIGDSARTNDYTSEDNSLFTRSRVRQELPATEAVAVEVALSDAYASGVQIDPEFTIEDLRPFQSTLTDFKPGTISDFHVAICAWVFYQIVPDTLVMAVRQPDLLPKTMITLARALLWKWGHHELSLLMSAPITMPSMDDAFAYEIPSSRTRIPAEIVEGVMKEVPYSRKKAKTQRDGNYAFSAINAVKDLMPSGIWQVKVPTGFPKPEYVDSTGNMSTPPDMIRLLSELFLDISHRSK
mgnify:CR=1 FL=1